MSETRPPNKKQVIVRSSLKRCKDYLKCSKDRVQINHRHGLCRGVARAYFDLGYMTSPEYRNWLFDIGQTVEELNALLPELYELYK